VTGAEAATETSDVEMTAARVQAEVLTPINVEVQGAAAHAKATSVAAATATATAMAAGAAATSGVITTAAVDVAADVARARPAVTARTNTVSATILETAVTTEDDRDKRTIFVQQISARAETRHLRNFFEVVGPVVEAQIVKDRVTHRSKG
jgi:hypothetical protein